MKLYDVAEEIKRLVPELKNRSVVVSDAAPTEENTPKLPIAMTMMERMDFGHNPTSNQPIQTTEKFVVEIWLELPSNKDTKGNETAYWAAYNYEPLVRRVVSGLVQFGRKQRGEYAIQAVSLDYGVNSFAVVLTFKFNFVYPFCMEDDADGEPMPVVIRLDLAPQREEPQCQ